MEQAGSLASLASPSQGRLPGRPEGPCCSPGQGRRRARPVAVDRRTGPTPIAGCLLAWGAGWTGKSAETREGSPVHMDRSAPGATKPGKGNTWVKAKPTTSQGKPGAKPAVAGGTKPGHGLARGRHPTGAKFAGQPGGSRGATSHFKAGGKVFFQGGERRPPSRKHPPSRMGPADIANSGVIDPHSRRGPIDSGAVPLYGARAPGLFS